MRHRSLRLLSLLALAWMACLPGQPSYPELRADGEYVRIPRLRVADGEVHFFTYRSRGKQINLLVRTDRTGTLRAHLDACYSCYHYRRGYVVEGQDLVCIACRYAYAIGEPEWDFIGACAPIPIRSRLEGEDLLIRRVLLERAARFF